MAPPRTLLLPLQDFLRVTVLVTALVWLVAFLGHILALPYPYRWPLFPRTFQSTFFDYNVYFSRMQAVHTSGFFAPGGFPFTYFAPGVLLYRSFYLFGRFPGLIVYFLFTLSAVVGGAVLLGRRLSAVIGKDRASLFVGVTAVCSYPIIFCLERGNLEIVLAIGIALGVWAFATGHPTLAAVLWGIFGSVKIYPLLLTAVFLTRRDFARIALTAVTTGVTTLLALWYTGPSIPAAIKGIRMGNNFFINFCTLKVVTPEWDHSLFCLLKLPAVGLQISFVVLLHVYLLVVGMLMLGLYLSHVRNLPISNRLVFLLAASVLIPPTSFDYTLTQLYAGWAILVLVVTECKVVVPSLRTALVIFALLFTPSNLVGIPGHQYNGQFKCLLLIGLVYLAARHPWPKPCEEETSSSVRLSA